MDHEAAVTTFAAERYSVGVMGEAEADIFEAHLWQCEVCAAEVRAMGTFMDHELAIRTQAAERYLLGEMDDTEAELFEAHFFQCEVCGVDVKALGAFVEALRRILR
jgi:anti-sigma factor RsiW